MYIVYDSTLIIYISVLPILVVSVYEITNNIKLQTRYLSNLFSYIFPTWLNNLGLFFKIGRAIYLLVFKYL